MSDFSKSGILEIPLATVQDGLERELGEMPSGKLLPLARGEGGGSGQAASMNWPSQGRSCGAWRSVNFGLRGACAKCTLGEGQAWQWCPRSSKCVAGNPEQGFPLRAQAWDVASHHRRYVSAKKETKDGQRNEGPASLVLRTQGTWCPQAKLFDGPKAGSRRLTWEGKGRLPLIGGMCVCVGGWGRDGFI